MNIYVIYVYKSKYIYWNVEYICNNTRFIPNKYTDTAIINYNQYIH